MTSRMKALILTTALALSACGPGIDESPRESTAAAYEDLDGSLAKARLETVELIGPNGDRARAAWDGLPRAKGWTEAVLQELETRKATLEVATDIDSFCPRYFNASKFEQDTCWLRIVSGMARYESEFRPSATYVEDWGDTSVGLLMMNPAHCRKAPTTALLKNAISNINCAMPRFSLLVARDKVLSGPGNTGAAAYWSVMRAPYRYKKLFLGRKPHIQEITRSYQAYREH